MLLANATSRQSKLSDAHARYVVIESRHVERRSLCEEETLSAAVLEEKTNAEIAKAAANVDQAAFNAAFRLELWDSERWSTVTRA